MKSDTGEQGPQGEVGPKGDHEKGAEGGTKYQGTRISGTTYSPGDTVSETANGIPGVFICLVESSSAEPSSSSEWRRIAGTESDIDGVSVGSDGKIEYNRITNVSAETFKPNFNGDLSWTLNISTSTEIDLSSMVDTSFNTNPAAVLRLVISAREVVTITFTGSDNYWLPEENYSAEPPLIAVGGTIPFIVVEVTLIINTTASGVFIQQVYPSVTSESSGPWVPGIWNTPGATVMLYYNHTQNVYDHDADEELPGSYFYPVCIFQSKTDASVSLQHSEQVASGTWRLQGKLMSASEGASVTQAIQVDSITMPGFELL
ncbi:hypothetical protein ACVEIO_024375 (plasmid) [Klebsiella aerogenes]